MTLLIAIILENKENENFSYVTLQKNVFIPYNIQDKVVEDVNNIFENIKENKPYDLTDFNEDEIISIIAEENTETEVAWVAEKSSETYTATEDRLQEALRESQTMGTVS